MRSAVRIAREEWREWMRSRLAVLSLFVFGTFLFFTTASTALDAYEARHLRLHQQQQAEKHFSSNLTDTRTVWCTMGTMCFTRHSRCLTRRGRVTGQSLFLEGHRQNSAMFQTLAPKHEQVVSGR